ncbi:30S ribosomal protein S20 [Candidatus Saccharibacteria bacterium]|nr:30S ribosomal protein S20 [Candidatus Saccharibacteria bacterium]
MPIIKSAKKRVKQARKATIRNAKTKRSLRESIKSFIKNPTADSHSNAQSNLDKAAKKGLVHKNKVARKKRQLAATAKASGATPVKKATTKTVAKKAPAKATAKSVAKTATKKAPAKKPTAKK